MSHLLQRDTSETISFLHGGAGEPFLLLHGIPGSALSWKAVGESLSQHFQVFLPDMLGFGESASPGRDYFLETQATALADFLDRQQLQEFYLAGHDIGAPLAITLMRLYPRFRIKGLVIASGNLLASTKIPPFFQLTRIPVFNQLFIRLVIGNSLAHRMIYKFAVHNKNSFTWEKYQESLTPSGRKYTRLMFHRTMAHFKSIYHPIEAFLPELTAPTLLLWGARDPILQKSLGKKIQRTIPDSSLKIYQESGHYLPEEQPEQAVEDILEFFGK